MNARREYMGKLAWLGLAAALTLACSEDKKTLLLVDVSLQADVAAPASVTIDVLAAGVPVGSVDFDWAKAKNGILQAGVFLPDSMAGLASVTATGKIGGVVQSRGFVEVSLLAEKTNGPISLVLRPIEVVGDAGVDAAVNDAPVSPDAQTDVQRGWDDAFDDETGGLAPADGGVDAPNVDAPAQDVGQAPIDALGADSDGGTAGEVGSDASGMVAWQPAVKVEDDTVARSYYPAVAVEPITENVYVAWYESTKVKVRRYDRMAGTWGDVKTIENGGVPADVNIGTDASGNVIVAWRQQHTGSVVERRGVWVSHSSDGLAWSPATQIAQGSVFSMAFAMARNGTARLAWERQTGTNQQGLFTAYYDKTTWKPDPTPVMDPNDPNSLVPEGHKLAVGGTGDGILVFDIDDAAGKTSVGAVTLTEATRSAVRILDTTVELNTNADNRAVAMNANGEGAVVWAENGNASATLNLSYFKPSSGWTSVQKVADSNEFYTVSSVLDDTGAITVAWVQATATSGHNVMAIHGKVGGVWSEMIPLENDNTAAGNYNEFGYPVLAVDKLGSVLAVWHKKINDITYGAYARRLQGNTWQPEVKLGQKADLKTLWPKVAVADSGFGAATFAYYSSTGNSSDSDAYSTMVAFCR